MRAFIDAAKSDDFPLTQRSGGVKIRQILRFSHTQKKDKTEACLMTRRRGQKKTQAKQGLKKSRVPRVPLTGTKSMTLPRSNLLFSN